MTRREGGTCHKSSMTYFRKLHTETAANFVDFAERFLGGHRGHLLQ